MSSFTAVDFAQNLFINAIQQRASDIHLEPQANHFRIRLRIDGLLHENLSLTKSEAYLVINHLKVLAQLDIAEHRHPQDGHFSFKTGKFIHKECRISSCPTIHGEKLVIRLLENSSNLTSLDQLGFEKGDLLKFHNALKKTHGLILVTGPTGSGKTLTLYHALSLLNQSTRNIVSIEDPVEIQLAGINQVNINQKIGLDFSKALRSFLRQDPNVIMLGEIRDLETAEMAIKAAQTGHLVLSTLHTNDTISSITRLLNLGITAYHIADSLKLVIAQRLVRKICTLCQQKGCAECKEGYQGRIGIYEVLEINPSLQAAISAKASTTELTELALKQGFQNLKAAAQLKAQTGITSLSEVARVID